MEQENQLPFMVGYIFMTATVSKRLGSAFKEKKEDVVTSKLLVQSAAVLKGMIESGFGGVERKILEEFYGMEIEIQRE